MTNREAYERDCDELEQYREIGTVEECKEAVGLKKYFDKLYGTGLEIANWHLNGDLEPFDNFYELGLKNFDGMD